MAKILISGGTVVTSRGIGQLDILVDSKKGKILAVGKSLKSAGAKRIDASKLTAFPGAIDPHVHFRDPEDTSKEDFCTGTSSALAGGVTTVIDMPCYRNPATTTKSAYIKKKAIAARRACCDWQLRFGASEKNQREAARSGAPSLKIFLTATGSELYCTRPAAVMHFASFPKKKPIVVHAEDQQRIDGRRQKYSRHEDIRDKETAQIACAFCVREARKLGRRVHLCHLTTAKEVDICRSYKGATYEINPAHLYLSKDDLHELGFLGRLNPPLRDRTEQQKLWRKVGDDTIIASDHAPQLPRHKKQGAPGFPGVGTLFPLMLQAAHRRRLTLLQIARICSYNAAKAFNLKGKGELAEGKDADIVLVDMKKKWRISAKNRLSKCGWTPFEGREVYGKIAAVYLRGRLAFDGEKVLSRPGNGKEVK